MKKVYIISEEEKNALEGKVYNDGQRFNPVQNNEDEWCLSIEEVMSSSDQYIFLRDKPTKAYKPKIDHQRMTTI